MTSQEQHRVPGRRPRALNTPQPIDQPCCGIAKFGPLSCRSSVKRDAAWSNSRFTVLIMIDIERSAVNHCCICGTADPSRDDDESWNVRRATSCSIYRIADNSSVVRQNCHTLQIIISNESQQLLRFGSRSTDLAVNMPATVLSCTVASSEWT